MQNVQKLQDTIRLQFPAVAQITHALAAVGGRVLLVGGAVRDLLLGKDIKDLDIEVHGLPLPQLEVVLKNFGPVRLVGKQFGVLRIDYLNVDWSIPRSDGDGRKPEVLLDPFMPVREAFLRRDLTINAMGIDLVTFELLDPFDGQKDLVLGILRAPDPTLFLEDPLRFFRVMQFVGRFEMYPDTELQKVCASMDISTVSHERIYQEFEKLFLQSARPSLAIQWLHDVGRLQEILPQLFAVIGVPQEPDWHPEGDVFEHTKQAIDSAAFLSLSLEDAEQRLILIIAALCHDLGKVISTKVIDGRIRALGHDVEGVPLAAQLLGKITNKQLVKDTVLKLVRYHMMPGQLIKNKAGDAAYKRLAKKLAPQTNCATLALLARADKSGRNPQKNGPFQNYPLPDIDAFIERVTHCGVLTQPEPPVLSGKDLLNVMDPGVAMGKCLEEAYVFQIEKGITDKEELMKMVIRTVCKK